MKIIDPETKEYKTSNENVFDLLFYKINKKKYKFQKKILEKYINSLQDISNMDELFKSSSASNTELKKCLNSFELYEFITKLIGDYKYQSPDEVYLVFDKLYIQFENIMTIFKSYFKQYKDDENAKKMDLKLIYNYLKAGLYLFLIRFLFIKYQIFNQEQLMDINNEGWKKFLEKNIDMDNKKIKLPKKLESKINKFKFIEFYSNFEILNIQIFDNQTKPINKFTKDNKNNINNCLGKLKSFANIDINKFIELFNKKKSFKSFSELSFKILFEDCANNNKENKAKRKYMFCTDIKVRNRLSMTDNENKDNKNKDKEDAIEDDDGSKEIKRNVKKKIKISQSNKKMKKKVKYRKSVIVLEENEENDD